MDLHLYGLGGNLNHLLLRYALIVTQPTKKRSVELLVLVKGKAGSFLKAKSQNVQKEHGNLVVNGLKDVLLMVKSEVFQQK